METWILVFLFFDKENTHVRYYRTHICRLELMSDDDIRKALRQIPDEEYPKDLYTATRAEYTTRVRTNKKPGCPLMGTIVLVIFSVVAIIANNWPF